jgi:hypothetical protein
MRATFFFLLCAVLATPLFAGEPTTALLIIDIQDFYFPGGKVPLVEPEPAGAKDGRSRPPHRNSMSFSSLEMGAVALK